MTSLGVRYSGETSNRLENDDINPDTYGGVSRFTFVDARVAYTTTSGIELALGIDNLTDEHAYQSHPYPGRTGFRRSALVIRGRTMKPAQSVLRGRRWPLAAAPAAMPRQWSAASARPLPSIGTGRLWIAYAQPPGAKAHVVLQRSTTTAQRWEPPSA